MNKYHSPKRQRQAQETRRRITASARELFATRGFGGTTIAAIAERAGVAPQTVYATFGSKAAVLSALLEGMEEAAGAAAWRETLADETDPTRLLGAFAHWTAEMLGTSRDLIATAQVAKGDSALLELATQGDAHRRTALESLIARIARAGSLRTGLTRTDAVDRAWLLTGVEPFLSATGSCGWSETRYAEWLAELLCQQLLDSSG